MNTVEQTNNKTLFVTNFLYNNDTGEINKWEFKWIDNFLSCVYEFLNKFISL